MRPGPQPQLPVIPVAYGRRRKAVALAGAALLGWATPVLAQDDTLPPQEAAAAPEGPVAFEADRLDYQTDADIVTATGNVILRREDQSVRADTVTWNRNTGEIVAAGNIRFVDQDGNQLFTDRVELTDELKAGAMENMLLVLREGGRLAANSGVRGEDGRIILTNAAYTACPVETPEGCPKEPSWRITAKRVLYDVDNKRVRYDGARLWVFGMPVLPLPGLSHSTDNASGSGLLVPELRLSASNGVEVNETYYWRLAPNRDLSVTGYLYTESLPMISGQYRELTDKGAYQVTAFLTRSERIRVGGAPDNGVPDDGESRFRGYVAGNGRFQLTPEWSVTAATRYASDRTFLRRYDISRDDRLRSTVNVERINPDSYLSIAGWTIQTLRSGESQGQMPIAIPAIDYRRRLLDPWLGGRIELKANTLGIMRTDGQDTQRAFVGAQWDLRRLTTLGHEVTLTGLVRGDVYHSDENELTQTVIYRGLPGWQTRGIATAALDVKWPFLGRFLGGTQVLTPRLQIVASPSIRNLEVPNEDARAIELEDSNLFALNRFPGYDRIEDGVRATYGLDWQLERPGWRLKTTVGQSYRLTEEPTLLPDGTGLSNRLSDVVGRSEVRFRDLVKLTHRFRLDKDSLAVRRNELDATVGSRTTYAEVGYLRLNRDIATGLEDLRDREELRLAGRVAFARYWSVFGSGVFNLTDREEDQTLTSDGFQPLRTRFGVSYYDECLEFSLMWRRDYVETGDARRGNSFQVRFALRNLGFR